MDWPLLSSQLNVLLEGRGCWAEEPGGVLDDGAPSLLMPSLSAPWLPQASACPFAIPVRHLAFALELPDQ